MLHQHSIFINIVIQTCLPSTIGLNLCSYGLPQLFLGFTLIASCEHELLILRLLSYILAYGHNFLSTYDIVHTISFEYSHLMYFGLLAQLSIHVYLSSITVYYALGQLVSGTIGLNITVQVAQTKSVYAKLFPTARVLKEGHW